MRGLAPAKEMERESSERERQRERERGSRTKQESERARLHHAKGSLDAKTFEGWAQGCPVARRGLAHAASRNSMIFELADSQP